MRAALREMSRQGARLHRPAERNTAQARGRGGCAVEHKFRMKQMKRKFVPYNDYMRSDAWKQFRSEYLEKKFQGKPTKCSMCFSFGPVDLHHRTYATLGNELMSHLNHLCRECHDYVHSRVVIGDSRKTSKIVKKLGRKWNSVASRNQLWSLRKTNPARFKELAFRVFRSTHIAGKEVKAA